MGLGNRKIGENFLQQIDEFSFAWLLFVIENLTKRCQQQQQYQQQQRSNNGDSDGNRPHQPPSQSPQQQCLLQTSLSAPFSFRLLPSFHFHSLRILQRILLAKKTIFQDKLKSFNALCQHFHSFSALTRLFVVDPSFTAFILESFLPTEVSFPLTLLTLFLSPPSLYQTHFNGLLLLRLLCLPLFSVSKRLYFL